MPLSFIILTGLNNRKEYIMKRKILIVLLFSFSLLNAQSNFNADTVKAQKFDTGTMWAFEYPPFEYLKQVYNFTPSQEWFDNVRLSAIRIPGCSASFVSSDGFAYDK